VRVEVAGLCHTDIHAARGEWATMLFVGLPHENETPIPTFQIVLNGISLRGSIVGTRQGLTEVFRLHRLGRIRVLRDHRPLERVNEALTEALQGSAATRRLVFAI